MTNSSSNMKSSPSTTTKRKVKRVRKKTVNHSPLIKYGSFVLLVAQLVGLVMLMRYSRTHTNGKDFYYCSRLSFIWRLWICYVQCNSGRPIQLQPPTLLFWNLPSYLRNTNGNFKSIYTIIPYNNITLTESLFFFYDSPPMEYLCLQW